MLLRRRSCGAIVAGVDPLIPEEIEGLRRRLVERRRVLREETQNGESWRATVELDQQSVGRLSRMDAIQQQAMAQAANGRRQGEMARIEAALARIEEGEFGWCARCGEPIGRRRLDVDATVSGCIACASGSA